VARVRKKEESAKKDKRWADQRLESGREKILLIKIKDELTRGESQEERRFC
jgi:hypothetical protein